MLIPADQTAGLHRGAEGGHNHIGSHRRTPSSADVCADD